MKIKLHRPHIGSTWYRGNFSFGILVDSHPRFLNVVLAFIFFELAISFKQATA